MSTILGLCVAYATGGLISARLVAGHLAWWFHESDTYKYGRDHPSGDQWFGAGICGALVGFVWPLLPAIFLMRGWSVGAEQRARIRKHEDRIRELERQLEISS